MRIQHNIMAMNAYRNLSTNNTGLSKNLEKLASGYRINRAGDDAAGLAISEKMRAQIAGLDQAQKNAQSGINLVQTAEGALTEVHDMLNRMTTLATQAANGTYSATDREKIQAEINSLTEEIDRIADNSNFNGTKLLDGSLSAKGTNADVDAFRNVKGALGDLKDVDAVNAKSTINAVVVDTSTHGVDTWENGTTIKMNFSTSDGAAHEITLTAQLDKDYNTNFVDADGNVVHTIANNSGAAADIDATGIGAALAEGIKNELGNEYKVTNTAGKLVVEHLPGGAEGLNITAVDISVTAPDTLTSLLDGSDGTSGILTPDTTNPPTNQIKGENATQALNFANAKVYDGETTSATVDLEDAIFEIDGKKFVFYDEAKDTKNEDKAASLEAIKQAGATVVTLAATGTAPTAADLQKMVNAIERETGLDVTQGDVQTSNGKEVFTEDSSKLFLKVENATSSKSGSGMTLQIGSEAVETIKVGVNSMKAKDLGIKGLSVKDEAAANDSIDKIKKAIETVSVQRGNLGAVQNRLEHTINNLGVMEENIQDAEANIRDTDIADEMMAYTKNNILIQSAQAMLAQANQAPQGVLQLMQ